MRKNAPLKNSHIKDYWLVTTEHLKEGLWFRDDGDFKVGMNYVALSALYCSVIIIAFVLMSNHVHFVLYCSYEEAQRFIDKFKENCSRYLAKKYGIRELLRKNRVVIQRISPDDESFERAVAYTHMNPPAANICLSPTGYPWGTGGAFFKGCPTKGIRMGSLSKRAASKLLHTKQALPSDWIIDDDGYILPESYVPVSLVESIFRTPKRMYYFLQNSSKSKRKDNFKGNNLPAFRDQVLISAIPDMCRTIFGRNAISELEEGERAELVKQLKRRFSADYRQIARATSIPENEVVRLLDVP